MAVIVRCPACGFQADITDKVRAIPNMATAERPLFCGACASATMERIGESGGLRLEFGGYAKQAPPRKEPQKREIVGIVVVLGIALAFIVVAILASVFGN